MQLLQNGKQQWIDSGGLPLANGTVGFYAVGTLNPLPTYQDQAGTIQNTNPLSLDSRGQAIVWGTGTYRQIVKDVSGVTIWDQTVASPDVATTVLQGNLADTANAANGDALVGVLQPFSGAAAQTQHRKNQDLITAFDFMTAPQIADVQGRTLLVDVTTSLQAAAATGKSFWLPDGSYKITAPVTLNSNQTVFMSAGALVRQYTPNTNIFKATQTDNTWVIGNGAVLYGEGTWSALWTGNSGHDDIGVNLIGCTRSGIAGIAFKNFAASAIKLWGGTRLRVVNFSIEGTNTYSTPLPAGSNFQNGIYMRDDATYGACDKIVITDGDISGTAQGILRENYGSTTANLGMVFSGLNIHDIPGQHGFYLQTGSAAIAGVVLTNIGGSGIKFQSADANQAINGCSATGIVGKVIGTSLFEINCTGTGSTNDVFLQGAADQAVNGLSTSGAVRDLRAQLELTNVTSNAVLIQGDGAKDYDIDITAQTVGADGILISATNATGLRFHRPRLRECNNANTIGAGISGIRIASASAQVELFDPDVTDVNTRMQYGLFNSVVGSIVKVRGSAIFSGASDTAVRTTGYIEEWPTEVNLLGNNGDFTNPNTVRSSQAMVMRGTTNSASNNVIWSRDLIAGKTYKIEAEIAWMRGDNSDRKSVRSVVLAYVNAGAAVIQGSPVESESIASAGVIGAYSWAVSGLQLQLLVTSTAATTYQWKARVTVTQAN